MINNFKGFYYIISYWTRLILNFKNRFRYNEKIYIIVPNLNSDWILLSMAKKIQKFSINSSIVDINSKIPKNSRYLLMHYSLLRGLINRGINLKRISIWFTHYRDDLNTNKVEYKFYFSNLHSILVSCTFQENLLFESFGRLSTKVIIGGFDEKSFYVQNSENRNYIGFCSAFYERKNPELFLKIISSMPQYNFILIGKNWENWNKFNLLSELQNFQYLDIDFNEYNEYYNKMKLFLSFSFIEGGPIPLLEAMSCGVYPIATKTGFAEDVITYNNGSVIEINDPIDNIVNLITFLMNSEIYPTKIADSVKNYTWDNFSKEFGRYI
jgi:glycosyltransferase involved in cell wall biosynthesis